MLEIDIDKKFNLGKLNLDLHKELNFAGDIIVKDHTDRLERGQGVNGPMQDLADSTIETKGFNQILVHEDKMRHLNRKDATKANQLITIFPGNERKRNGKTNAQIGAYHQEGGGNLPKREWFGITKQAENKCLKLIENKIDKILRKL
tara:strand:+ start:1847 stop:2287 length:441 start_codon:yes stop_codon:yes gene_type:complete